MLDNALLKYFVSEFLKHLAINAHDTYEIGIATMLLLSLVFALGFPGGSVVMSQCRRCGFDPWVRKIPWRRKWQPTPVFLSENPMDRGCWWTVVHVGHKRVGQDLMIKNNSGCSRICDTH